MARLLRHDALKEALPLSPDGYVPVAALLQHPRLKSVGATSEDVERIVATDAKGRYKLRDGCVCALQGHSLPLQAAVDDLALLPSQDLPSIIVHGTYRDKLPLIARSGGLSRMSRNHVHFAAGLPSRFQVPGVANNDAVKSGMRNSCQVLIFLDVQKLRDSQLSVYRSGNGVILVPGDANGIVSVDLFDKVYDVQLQRYISL